MKYAWKLVINHQTHDDHVSLSYVYYLNEKVYQKIKSHCLNNFSLAKVISFHCFDNLSTMCSFKND